MTPNQTTARVACWAMLALAIVCAVAVIASHAGHTCNGPTGIYTGPWGQQHIESYDAACSDPSVIQ